MTLERRTHLKRGKPIARTAMKSSRKPIPQRSDARREDADRQAEVRAVVFARDGHRCVLAPWARTTFAWIEAAEERLVIVPACNGRLTFGHRRKASAGGAYVPANGWATCVGHQDFIECYPDAARALGGECPDWLVVREGDACWDELGRKATGTR